MEDIKYMNKKKILIIIGIVVIIFLCFFYYIGTNDDTDIQTTNNEVENNVNFIEEIEYVEVIYEYDNGINLFINKYNEANENKITSDMLIKKHIGGKDRDNVVTVANDKLEIVIYNNYESSGKYNISVYIGYKAEIKATLDDYKEQFIKYIKLFDETLSDNDINNYWNDMISDYHSSYEINDIDILTSTNNGNIEYFKFTKNLEL